MAVIVVVIPAYNPPQSLLDLATEILEGNQLALVIVNDGSTPEYAPLFDSLGQLPGVHILKHKSNRGKGAALKTAFLYSLETFPQAVGVVTADADSQHLPMDIAGVAQALESKPFSLCIGSRLFKVHSVPWTNKFGNRLTKLLFKILFGAWLPDTQSGLRGIPSYLLPHLIKLPSSAYEFELDMLIFARQNRVEMLPVPISTVYMGKNTVSYFHPVVDSFRIYMVLLRFTLLSILTAVLGAHLVLFFYTSSLNLISSIALGKGIVMSISYFLVKKHALRCKAPNGLTLALYMVVFILWTAASYLLISFFQKSAGLEIYPAVTISEYITFVPVFLLLRDFVFRHSIPIHNPNIP
jgi:glycosyltransferase involved in cell wall biosynthesis